MATDPYWQLEKEYTTLTADHDLTVKAIEYGDVTRTENDKAVTTKAPTKVHEYRLSRETLINASPVFRKLLTNANFRESEQHVVELHEDPPQTLKIWLEIFHKVAPFEELVETVNFKGLWDLLATAHKYEIDPKSADSKAWFEAWWKVNVPPGGKNGKRLGYVDNQALLLPCWAFDHAKGWQSVTKHRKLTSFRVACALHANSTSFSSRLSRQRSHHRAPPRRLLPRPPPHPSQRHP